jgi:tetratricopeptide (TPR) repeat protein
LAISLARTALHYEQQNPEIFFYFARALLAVAQRSERKEERSFYYDEALTAFSQARALAPLDGTYPLEIAYLYDTIHRFPEAEKMYAEAKARDPRSMAIAQLYQAHLESLQKLTEAKTPKPTSPDK